MIDLKDVSVQFEDAEQVVRAVDNVSFSAGPGVFTWISGPSGSGKSTLLNVICGLVQPKSGQATVAGLDIVKANRTQLADLRLRNVGVVFQENNLIREFSASENVELPLRARGMKQDLATELADEMLKEVGLQGLGGRSIVKLSGGQRQRVGIARALVGGRTCLIADEPTGSLDSANSRAIFELLRKFANEGVCVVVASHDSSVENLVDSAFQMLDGKISERY